MVREIDAQTGVINTVIGTAQGEGTSSQQHNLCTTAPCGDGGAATSALLSAPKYVALDSQGNMYVYDSGTDVVPRSDGWGWCVELRQPKSRCDGWANDHSCKQPVFNP